MENYKIPPLIGADLTITTDKGILNIMTATTEELQATVIQQHADIRKLKSDNYVLQSYLETEKEMRKAAEHDLSKFRKVLGRIFWLKK